MVMRRDFMEMLVYQMEIVDRIGRIFRLKIYDENSSVFLTYDLHTRIIGIEESHPISDVLKRNEYQLRKILHNKREDTYFVGFKLTFAIRDKKDVAAFNDRSRIIALDKRGLKPNIYVTDRKDRPIWEAFTDGCFLDKIGQGGYASLIKYPEGNYKIFSFQTNEKSSSLIELLAAIKAVELLAEVDKIRLVTDSQYVRKGLTEWILNWKLNHWMTANGEPVKNREHWEHFDNITEGKLIEFEWIKGHSEHFENDICDLFAREMAEQEREDD
jgi:ribonuclease HI